MNTNIGGIKVMRAIDSITLPAMDSGYSVCNALIFAKSWSAFNELVSVYNVSYLQDGVAIDVNKLIESPKHSIEQDNLTFTVASSDEYFYTVLYALIIT